MRRIPQKEVEIVKVSNAWYFPLATGDLRQPTAGSKPSTPRRRKLHSMKEEQDKEDEEELTTDADDNVSGGQSDASSDQEPFKETEYLLKK